MEFQYFTLNTIKKKRNQQKGYVFSLIIKITFL